MDFHRHSVSAPPFTSPLLPFSSLEWITALHMLRAVFRQAPPLLIPPHPLCKALNITGIYQSVLYGCHMFFNVKRHYPPIHPPELHHLSSTLTHTGMHYLNVSLRKIFMCNCLPSFTLFCRVPAAPPWVCRIQWIRLENFCVSTFFNNNSNNNDNNVKYSTYYRIVKYY